LFLGTGPGDLFLTRNVGNVVPITSQDVDGVSATIEYAVEVLRVKDAIVCGHSDCGAMKAALGHTALEGLPKAERWLNHVEAAFAYRQPLNPADGDGAELASLIRGNVVAQLMNLRVQPSVKRATEEGRLKTHGWYYDILSGRIECFDEKQKKFVPLVKPGSEKRGRVGVG
jgi:carbonic anhydrase